MTDDLPRPLAPADADLRDFPYLPLDVVRFRDSGFAARSTGEEFRAGVLLICAAWHQTPAASLPNDDHELAALAGFGRILTEWHKVKPGALRGWILCADGRLYHPVVAEKANAAWAEKVYAKWLKECDRIRKQNKPRADKSLPPLPIPPLPEAAKGSRRAKGIGEPYPDNPPESVRPSAGIPAEKPAPSGGRPEEAGLGSGGIPEERPAPSGGSPPQTGDVSGGVPWKNGGEPEEFQRKTLLKRKGEGEGIEKIPKSSSSSSTAARAKDDDDLLAKLREAAGGHLARGCANVAPIRALLDAGYDLETDVLPVFRQRMTKLVRPLQNLAAPWVAAEICAFADARKAPTFNPGGGATRAQSGVFVSADDPRWPSLCTRWRKERGGRSPPTGKNPHRPGGPPGWYFSPDWLAPNVSAAAPKEAAE